MAAAPLTADFYRTMFDLTGQTVLLTGGYGYVAGALSGVLVLGTIQTLIAFDGTLSSWWTRIVIGGRERRFEMTARLVDRR